MNFLKMLFLLLTSISVSATSVCSDARWEIDTNYLGKRPDTPGFIATPCSKINIGGSDPSQNYLYNTLSKCKTNCENTENCNIISRYGGKSNTANWHCWGYSCPDFGNINWITQTQWGNGKESSNIYKLYCTDSTTIPTTTPTTSPTEIFNAFPNFSELLSPADGDKINNWITLSEQTRIPPGVTAAYDGYIVPHGTESYKIIWASANWSMEESGMCCPNSVEQARASYPSRNLLYLPNFKEPVRWSEQVWVPCYQKLVDGKKSEDFHSKCDGKGPTVTVAKLNNGKLIGGYAGISWASSGGFTKSPTSFLFSLTDDRQYNLKSGEEEYAQFHSSGYGPTFGHGMDLKFIPSGGSADDVGCSMGDSYECNGHGSCSNDFCGASDGVCCYWRIVDNLVVWHHLEITQGPTSAPTSAPTSVPTSVPTSAPTSAPAAVTPPCVCNLGYRNGASPSNTELCMGPSEGGKRPCYPYTTGCNADWTYCSNPQLITGTCAESNINSDIKCAAADSSRPLFDSSKADYKCIAAMCVTIECCKSLPPTKVPTALATKRPTPPLKVPTALPTKNPTLNPATSSLPTPKPSLTPAALPTKTPTLNPATSLPPTSQPSLTPTPREVVIYRWVNKTRYINKTNCINTENTNLDTPAPAPAPAPSPAPSHSHSHSHSHTNPTINCKEQCDNQYKIPFFIILALNCSVVISWMLFGFHCKSKDGEDIPSAARRRPISRHQNLELPTRTPQESNDIIHENIILERDPITNNYKRKI